MSSELRNIPSVWTAISHWLAYMLYIGLLPKRLKGWRFTLVALGFLALQCAYHSQICDLTGTAFNVAMTIFALITLLPFAALCPIGWRGQVYYGARAFILGGFAVSLAWQIYIFYAQRVPVLTGRAGEILVMLVIFAAVYLLMTVLEWGHRQELGQMPISTLSCVATTLIAFIIYIISSLSFSPLETPFGGSTYAEAFNIRTIVYLGGVAILFSYHLQLCDSHVRQEVTALQNMLNMQYANYCLSQESVDLVNQKYHDLKHQIAVLRAEIGTEQKMECLDQMEREIRAYETQNKTGNKVLDTILTSKSVYCQNHDIRFTCVADGHALDFMEVVDLSTLFGNALDNAIEGVSQFEDPEQRLIHLSVSRQKSFLRIRVENRCREDLTVGKGLPGTTKKDKNLHGYGLKSIQATAEKYGGSLTVRAENGWFELRVLIPLPEEAEMPSQP